MWEALLKNLEKNSNGPSIFGDGSYMSSANSWAYYIWFIRGNNN